MTDRQSLDFNVQLARFVVKQAKSGTLTSNDHFTVMSDETDCDHMNIVLGGCCSRWPEVSQLFPRRPSLLLESMRLEASETCTGCRRRVGTVRRHVLFHCGLIIPRKSAPPPPTRAQAVPVRGFTLTAAWYRSLSARLPSSKYGHYVNGD